MASASDGRHRDADAMLRRLVAARVPLITTNLVLAEIHHLALARMGVRAASDLLAKIESSRLVTTVFPGAAEHQRAREWLDRFADQKLSYTDAVSFAVMEAERCEAVMTFDRHFALAGFRVYHLEP